MKNVELPGELIESMGQLYIKEIHKSLIEEKERLEAKGKLKPYQLEDYAYTIRLLDDVASVCDYCGVEYE